MRSEGALCVARNRIEKLQEPYDLKDVAFNPYATNVIYIYIYMKHPFLMFLDHTQRHSTVGRTPLDE